MLRAVVFLQCVCVGGYAHRVSAVQLLQQSEVGSFRESALLVHQSQQAQFLRQRKERTSCCCIGLKKKKTNPKKTPLSPQTAAVLSHQYSVIVQALRQLLDAEREMALFFSQTEKRVYFYFKFLGRCAKDLKILKNLLRCDLM